MKQYLKSILTSVLFLTCGLVGHAENLTLVVWQKDGHKVYYQLNEQPKTTFTTNGLVITTHMMEVSYPLSAIQRYTYATTAGIDKARNNHDVEVSQNGTDVTFTNLKAGSEIRIYGTDGALLDVQSAKENSVSEVSLASYPTGVYILKVNDVTYKIMKK